MVFGDLDNRWSRQVFTVCVEGGISNIRGKNEVEEEERFSSKYSLPHKLVLPCHRFAALFLFLFLLFSVC